MKSVTGGKLTCGFLLLGGMVFLDSDGVLAINTVGDYQKSPAFVTSPVQPLTMLILDNSGSMDSDAYTDTYTATKNYYGLFEPDKYYYHPFYTQNVEVCNYTGISGQCSTSVTKGTCTYPTRTCTTSDNYYTCFRAAGTSGSYTNNSCDGPDSGTGTDCPSGASCIGESYTCVQTEDDFGNYSNNSCDNDCDGGYSCVQYYACYDNNDNDRHGSYGTSNCGGSCTSSQTCKPRTGRYLCYRPGGSSGSYTNATCDGPDGGSTTDCTGGAACSTVTYTCNIPADSTGVSYNNATCDGGDGNTTTDCTSGYSCVGAYQCTRSGYTPTGVYANATCDGDDSNSTTDCGSSWSCSPIISSNTVDWSGQTCATCVGTCATTGTTTIAGYDCVADAHAQCDNYDGWNCATYVETTNCAWTDWVQRAVCQAGGGTCTDNPAVPGLQGSCATAANQADCATKYHGTCATELVDTTIRAPFWRKTPADATNAVGWNCNTGDCVGGTVTLGKKLNHDQMTRMDTAKKVLTGGATKTPSSITGTIELDGDYSSLSYTCITGAGGYTRSYCNNPDHSATTCANGSACVPTGNNGNIVLQPDDPAPAGILQHFEGLAWGYSIFHAADDPSDNNSYEGGKVVKPIGTPNAEIVAAINSTLSETYTPLGESLNTVVNYFKQAAQEYHADEYTRDTLWDPFYDDNAMSYAPCGRASAILITDGEPNNENHFNTTVDDAASGVTGNVPTYGSSTYYVDDVAYWAHTNDLRTEAQMGGSQNMDFYAISAFGGGTSAETALQGAAKLGGFIDKDGDNMPNSAANEASEGADTKEWDFDGDGLPDNYAKADEGDLLAVKLQNMLGQIVQKVSAGSAASVISSSRSGEGAIYQAVFYPKTQDSSSDYNINTWIGDVHAIWLDDFGNMREDCGPDDTAADVCTYADGILNPKTDKIIEYYTDPVSGEARLRVFGDPDGDGRYISGTCSVSVPSKSETTIKEVDCVNNGGTWTSSAYPDLSFKEFTHYLWSGGLWLANLSEADTSAQRSYSSTAAGRYIFTQDSIAGGKIDFTPAALNAALGSSKYKGYLNAASETEADKIVNWVRGVEITGYRKRVYDWGSGEVVNKLGDIIGSTPTVVIKPAEDYDMVYLDESYRQFRREYDKRRTVVYTGANDGGLHAFNGGYYDRTSNAFLNAPPDGTDYDLGAEMWMYIPKNILPHLKWLTDPNYSHIYYVDLKPYVFDAKIFNPSDGIHTGGWGTLLVGGMGFGGGDFHVDTDSNGSPDTYFRSSYFILDITDPDLPPVLLAEFTDPGLGFTLAAPTAIPMLKCNRKVVGDCPASWPMDWFLALPSGPHNDSAASPNLIQTAMLGKSDQTGKVYLLKLGGTGGADLPIAISGSTVQNVPTQASGSPFVLPAGVGPSGVFPKSFLSDVIAVDHDLNFKTDVLYLGSVANTNRPGGSNYTGGMHRLVTGESSTTSGWSLNTMLDVGKPVIAAPTAGYDGSRIWVYFGTGRLLNAFEDKSDTSPQAYFGLKESYTVDGDISFTTPNAGNLVDVSKIKVKKSGELYDTSINAPAVVKSTGGDTLLAKTFKELNYEISEKLSGFDRYNGWKLNFSRSKERNLGQAALLGQALTYTTYVPSGDVCEAEGESYLWALYYRTGTAFPQPIIGVTGDFSTRDTSIGAGMATTPNITPKWHIDYRGGESKAFIQTSTGAIITIDQANPVPISSHVVSWRDRDPE